MDSASSAAFFLALIAIADGLRLLPPGGGAIVVLRGVTGAWSVAFTDDAETPASRVRLVTWCSPLLLPLVLRTGDGAGKAEPRNTKPGLRRVLARFHARRRRTRRWIAALRVWGVITLVALVAGIPYLTARIGAWGLMAGIALVFLLSIGQSVMALIALRRSGMRSARAALGAARFLWPFTAPRAAEEVMRQVVAGMPPLVLLHELLGPRAFARYARPRLYDAVVRGVEDDDVRLVRRHMGAEGVAEALRLAPESADGDAYCPRCGASFVHGTRHCSDCAGIELVTQPAP